MAELKYWLWLTSRRGMDSVRALKLLERFVTPEQVYYADQGDIAELGLSPNLERSLADKSMDAPEVILGECDRLDVRVMTIQDADYPMRLRQIADPPAVLYLKGRRLHFDEEAAIAVVGAREPTAYGRRWAEQFGMDVDMVKKYLVKEQVQDQLLSQKAVAVVVDSATAEKPKKAAKKEEAAEGEEKKPAKKTTKKAEAADGEEKPKKAPAKKAAKKEAEKEAE